MKAVIILCAVALIMANAQELNQYDVNGVHVVDGAVDPVKVVDGQGNAGYPAINNPDSYFYQQPQRPGGNYPGGYNGGYPVIADQYFYQPSRPYYPGGNGGQVVVQNPDPYFYQGGQGGVRPNNPNIDINPTYVQNPSNYPAHLYPGGNPVARDGK